MKWEAGSAMAFEWTKVRTLRSTLWSLVVFLLVTVAVSYLFGHYHGQNANAGSDGDGATFDPVSVGFSGLKTGILALVAFGVVVVTSEYATGTIRSSLSAVPRRGVFYGAKLLTTVAIAAVVSTVVVLVGFLTAQTAMGGAHNVSPLDEGVPRALLGGVLYATLLCAFAMGLASVLRSAALTIGILAPLFFMVSTLLNNIPGVQELAQFLPDVAGGLILRGESADDTLLGPWSGMAVLAAWAAVAVTAGYVAVRRRDL